MGSAGGRKGCGPHCVLNPICPYWKQVMCLGHLITRDTCTCTPVHDLYGSKFCVHSTVEGNWSLETLTAGKPYKSTEPPVDNVDAVLRQ